MKALRTQLGQTLGIAQVSDTAKQYEANIRRVFGGQGDLFKKRKRPPTEAALPNTKQITTPHKRNIIRLRGVLVLDNPARAMKFPVTESVARAALDLNITVVMFLAARPKTKKPRPRAGVGRGLGRVFILWRKRRGQP